MLQLLLYAEQPLVRHAICALLNPDREISVMTTDCIHTFNAHLIDDQYHVILFATEKRGRNSIADICTTLEQIQPITKLFLLLGYVNPCCMEQLLSLNVSVGLTKDCIDISLPHIIRAVVAGKSIFTRGVIEKLLDKPILRATLDQIDLTNSERAVVDLMVQGYSNQQIASALCLAHQTIRNTVSRVYEKIGVHSRTEFIHWAQEKG